MLNEFIGAAVRYRIIAVLVLALSLMAPTSAQAFMTWNTPGNAEHERITRFALACLSPLERTDPAGSTWAKDLCLSAEPSAFNGQYERTLRMIAGASGYFGGVGAPDRFAESVISSSDRAHCDNSDAWYSNLAWPLNGGVYPRTTANRDAALFDCLNLLQKYMSTAVQQAGLMVRADGTVDQAQTDLTEDCNVDYDPDLAPNEKHKTGGAKCNALISFGRALHIAEDFFSHSNWVDQNPAQPGPQNPPGLGNGLDSMPSALRYPKSGIELNWFLMDHSVITGAFPTPSIFSTDPVRIYHNNFLNKDEGNGVIDWVKGTIPAGDGGHSQRASAGVINGQDNFQRAVRSAATAASLLWSDLHTAVMDEYGTTLGSKVWYALRANTPWTTCVQSGDARNAYAPPNGKTSAARTVKVTLINNTNSSLSCLRAVLDYGEWSSLPPSELVPGASADFLALSNGSGTAGLVDLGAFTLSFNNPYIGSNSYSCNPAPGFSCSIVGGRGEDAHITVAISKASTRAKNDDTVHVSAPMPSKANGVTKAEAQAAKKRDQRVVHTMSSLNHEASKASQARLDVELAHMKKCRGDGAKVDLNTDDISCGKAMRLLTKTHTGLDYQKFCPAKWHVIYDPKGIDAPQGAVLCHQDQGKSPTPDKRARAFWYVLPHALGNMG